MDVKYFKPVKRTEENSTEEWLILCLISQIGALPRGLAWVFERPRGVGSAGLLTGRAGTIQMKQDMGSGMGQRRPFVL